MICIYFRFSQNMVFWCTISLFTFRAYVLVFFWLYVAFSVVVVIPKSIINEYTSSNNCTADHRRCQIKRHSINTIYKSKSVHGQRNFPFRYHVYKCLKESHWKLMKVELYLGTQHCLSEGRQYRRTDMRISKLTSTRAHTALRYCKNPYKKCE
jgi:hypothetical protein